MNENDALRRYMQLTAIAGTSGDEKQIATAIIRHLTDAGISADQIAVDDAGQRSERNGNQGNVIVTLPGDPSLPRTMLSAHMDTVPVCLGSRPERRGDEIVSSDDSTGLGADDRAGCAAILTAVIERIGSPGPHGPAVVTFLVQEEIGLKGARYLDRDKLGHVDRAFNFDGGSPAKITIGAIGGERMEIAVTGLAAHAGVAPENGVSAVVIASKAIAKLDAGGWLGRIEKGDQFGTANVGLFRGGEATNVITPHVEIRAEARSHDGEFRREIVNQIRTAFESAAAETTNVEGVVGKIQFQSQVDYEAFRLADDHPSIAAAEAAIEELGRTPERMIGNGGLDANWLYLHGIEAVTLGCGQRNIHTINERLDIPDFLDACRIATAMIA